ncbi:unnamed protein product [Didymodactylos carnosus]|uniref:Peptidase M14 domain-containing protein n=1 Tax=Didymodactylos carnosus TaxID=1234261 RepID=A0A8S2CZ21_9BILA|nr:unnamed protein product [Didymodactylos carnosus]CAF3624391.1 unnamed protein product [Didymodactylos carnosus]
MASALSTYVSKDLFTDERLTILFIPDEVISEHESTLYQLFNNSDDFIKHVENKLDKQVTVIMVLRLLPVDSIKPFLANLESLVQIIALHIFCTNVELYTLLKAERIDHGLHDIKKKMNKLQRHERVYERQKRDLDRRDSELIDVLVPPTIQLEFAELLKNLKISYDITIKNIGPIIEKQFLSNQVENNADYNYAKYHNIADINAWIDQMVAAYPDLASTFSVGKSYEQRDMKCLKLSDCTKWSGNTCRLFSIIKIY